MAKTATKTNKNTANRKKTIFNIDNAPKEKTKKAVTNKNLVKQIEKLYNNGMGPRRMGKMLNTNFQVNTNCKLSGGGKSVKVKGLLKCNCRHFYL